VSALYLILEINGDGLRWFYGFDVALNQYSGRTWINKMKSAQQWIQEAKRQAKKGEPHPEGGYPKAIEYMALKCEELQLALNDFVIRECEDCNIAPYSSIKRCNEKSCPIVKYRKLLN
jgi:hypothetical protein